MKLTELISPDRIVLGVRAADKAHALREVAKRASAHLPVEASVIFAAIDARERLGSTGFGRGFALPHVRIDGLQSSFGLLMRLGKPVEYEAIDKKPVDILFLLLIPNDKGTPHVAELAAVSRTMREEGTLRMIRSAGSSAILYDLLVAAEPDS